MKPASGQHSPRTITTAFPAIVWTYVDPNSLAQTAYQILVTSPAGQALGTLGDMWNSGIVVSALAGATYAGEALQSNTVYQFTVRVRNSAGAWSS